MFILNFTLLQAILVFMYRELLSYCTYPPPLPERTPFIPVQSVENIHLPQFMSGNVFYQFCLGAGPRATLFPRRTMGVIAAFLGLFDLLPSCVYLVDCPDRFCSSVKASLPWKLKSTSVNEFNNAELERCLSIRISMISEKTRLLYHSRLSPDEITETI